jgi:hypothetical protein
MEFHDWEFDLEVANGKMAFYALCRKSIEHQGLMDHINAECPQLLRRIALEIDMGELVCSALSGQDSLEKAKEYILLKMASASNNEQFYGIHRAPWIKGAVVQFLERDVHVPTFNIAENIPGSLLSDRDVIRAAILAKASNMVFINSALLQAYADDLLLADHRLFSCYLNMDNMDADFATALIVRKPSLYKEISKYEENADFSDIYTARIDMIQSRLSEIGWNPQDHLKKSLVKRIQQAFVDTFMP